MTSVLLMMFALIGAGFLWGQYNPARMDSAVIRKVLADMIYSLFLPALVLNVLWKADLGIQSAQIATSAAIGVLLSMLAAAFLCRFFNTDSKTLGAVLLASSFPNATYLGYSVLTKTLGDWAGPVAIQYDLFACTPILLTLGIVLAARLGDSGEKPHPLLLLIKVPPLWAAAMGSALNLLGVEQADIVGNFLELTGAVVIPVMLFVIGLALKKGFQEWRHGVLILPIAVVQLLLMPLIVYFASTLMQSEARLTQAVVLEGAMPSMVLGIVLCDRYGLNSGLYAMAVTVTTLLSIISLPLWYSLTM